MQFFKAAENPDIICKSGLYALKYTLKAEPSFATTIRGANGVIDQLHARFISSEEACGLIFSRSFCRHDTQVISKTAAPLKYGPLASTFKVTKFKWIPYNSIIIDPLNSTESVS
jgi:hypothetical protein